MENITILGSTGSIGVSTLDVISQHPDRYRVYALTANTQFEKMMEQCLAFQPKVAVMKDKISAQLLATRLNEMGSKVEVYAGEEGLIEVAENTEADTVMASIVGAAGLVPTLAAVNAGKKVCWQIRIDSS